jgi:F0F1-type ATP synthase beta subunit
MNIQTANPAYQKLLNIISQSKKPHITVGSIRQRIEDNDIRQILVNIPDETLIGQGAEGRLVSTYIDASASIHHWIFNIFGECKYIKY